MKFNISGLLGAADGVAHLLGAGMMSDTLKSAITPYLNQYNAEKASALDWKHNKQLAIWNMLSQDEANKRTESLQREAWQRDDTSYQRTVKDMNAAGINPLLIGGAQGSSAASFSGGSAGSSTPTNVSEFPQGVSPLSYLMQIAQFGADYKFRDAENNLKENMFEDSKARGKAQDDRADVASSDAHSEHNVQMQILAAERRKAEADASLAEHDLKQQKTLGYSNSSTDKYKTGKEVAYEAVKAANAVSEASKPKPKEKLESAPVQSNKSVLTRNQQDFYDWLYKFNSFDAKEYLNAVESKDYEKQMKIFNHHNQRYMRSIKKYRR